MSKNRERSADKSRKGCLLGSVLVTQKSPAILTSTVSKNSVGKTGLEDVLES